MGAIAEVKKLTFQAQVYTVMWESLMPGLFFGGYVLNFTSLALMYIPALPVVAVGLYMRENAGWGG